MGPLLFTCVLRILPRKRSGGYQNPLQDTPQTSLSKRKPRGKPAGSTTLAAASSGIQNTSGTSRRRGLASLGARYHKIRQLNLRKAQILPSVKRQIESLKPDVPRHPREARDKWLILMLSFSPMSTESHWFHKEKEAHIRCRLRTLTH